MDFIAKCGFCDLKNPIRYQNAFQLALVLVFFTMGALEVKAGYGHETSTARILQRPVTSCAALYNTLVRKAPSTGAQWDKALKELKTWIMTINNDNNIHDRIGACELQMSIDLTSEPTNPYQSGIDWWRSLLASLVAIDRAIKLKPPKDEQLWPINNAAKAAYVYPVHLGGKG